MRDERGSGRSASNGNGQSAFVESRRGLNDGNGSSGRESRRRLRESDGRHRPNENRGCLMTGQAQSKVNPENETST